MTELLLHITSELDVDVHSLRCLGGGDISQAYHVETAASPLFIKVNEAKAFPGMFEKEAKGLKLLRDHSSLQIPACKRYGHHEGIQFIILEYIEETSPAGDFFRNFGSRLAAMHQVSSGTFGLAEENYIGSLTQRNQPSIDWSDFFINQRIEPMLRQASLKGLLDSSDFSQFDLVCNKLDDLYPHEQPALLHGDLWSGNFMSGKGGQACVFDPAVYYGHREMDLAMSRLFGGFELDFYQSYCEQYALEPGWEARCDLWNLYPLLVHLNLFGPPYLSSIREVLTRFA